MITLTFTRYIKAPEFHVLLLDLQTCRNLKCFVYIVYQLTIDDRGSICMLFFSISMFILLIYGMIQTFIIRVVAFSILRRYYNFRLFSF